MTKLKLGKVKYRIMRDLVNRLEEGTLTRGKFLGLMLSALYPKNKKENAKKYGPVRKI